MDLAGMLNDGDAPPKRPSQTSPPESNRTSAAPQASPSAPNGTYAVGPGAYAQQRPIQQQQTPLFGPPSASAGPPSQSQSRGLTPLQTPSQTPGAQYPFPQQPPSQSPASAHPAQQPYRPYEPYSATTPGARPPSHGYTQSSHPVAQYPNPHSGPHTSSLSPTPPSHAGQTPHSVRQSPLATMGHPPPPAPPHHYHQSQPNTPLGPPSQIPQRHSNQSNNSLDMSSPYHQRTYSGASNGIVSGSPAQHHPSIGNLLDSPGVYNRPSPHTRRTSDYRSSVDRERSVSVSPKTIVQPRPSSLGSRHSSQQDVHMRGSDRAPSADTPSHVQHPLLSRAPSEVAQAPLQAAGSLPGPPVNGDSLSRSDNKTPLQHQPSKMGMSHLLAPTQHAQPQSQPKFEGAPLKMEDTVSMPSQSQSQSHPPPQQQSSTSAETHAPEQNPIKSDPETSIGAVKRPAESALPDERTTKRSRVRKYTERPIWAHLSKHNPRAQQAGVVPNGRGMHISHPRPAPAPAAQPAHTNGGSLHVNPWEREPPLDIDLIHAREILGMRWEKSIKWNVPNPSLNTAVADWLFGQLEQFAEASQPGATIEIEAKIGTLVDDSGNRCALPVRNTCVLDVSTNRRYHFDSEMNELEHKYMNEFLNAAIKESLGNKGRCPMTYQRIRETDSFRTLNEAGLSTLPAAAQKRRGGRQLSMRTSTDTNTGQVRARIVKVKLGEDLQIFGALNPYDIRISMNLEIDLNKPGFDPDLMTVDPNVQAPQPNRKKDRLSYKHLAYSVDLTRVTGEGNDYKYELELEMDPKILMGQYEALKQGHPHAYSNIVDGFVDNMMYLVKQPRRN